MELREKIVDNGSVDDVSLQEILDMQPEKISEGKLIDIKDKSDCDHKDEDIPEEKRLTKNFTLKELSDIFHNKKAKINVGN